MDPLIGKLYEAAVQPAEWPRFLEDLAAVVGADAMSLLAASVDGPGMRELTFDVGTDGQAAKDYREYFGALDPYIEAGSLDLPAGKVIRSDTVVSDADLVRTEFYNDFYKRNGWHHGFGAKIFEDSEGVAATLTGHRRQDAGPFGPEALDVLSRLLPHLRRALAIRRQVEGIELERDAGSQLLERVSIGTLLVDQRGRLVRTNRIGDEILAANDGLRIGAEGLETATPKQTAALRRAIAGAAETSRGEIGSAGGRLRVTRPSGGRPYLLEVSPVDRGAEVWGSTKCLAAILVTDGNGGIQPDIDALRTFYDLTPAEAELTAMLAHGLSLDEAAERRGVSRNTARGQLKRIFSKTGTNRQAELIRQVLQGPAGFARR